MGTHLRMLCSWGCHRDSLAGEDCTQGSLWMELYPYCRTDRQTGRERERQGKDGQGELETGRDDGSKKGETVCPERLGVVGGSVLMEARRSKRVSFGGRRK